MLSRFVNLVKVRLAHRQRLAARQKAARGVIGQSKLFDARWYAERYPDVAAAGLDPLDHFIRHGAAEGRNPSDRFDLRWYLGRNPDVVRSGINPLLHYLEYGRDEGRSIRAVGSKTGADEDADIDALPLGKKGKVAKPRAAPYPSDFTSIWQPRSVAWSAFSQHLHPAEAQPALPAFDRHTVAADWLAGFLQTEQGESAHSARIRLFEAMKRDSDRAADEALPAKRGDLDAAARDRAHRLLTIHGLGLDAIADGWFSGAARLMLRIRATDTRATQLRAFHYSPSGDIACCGAADILDGEIQLISLTLDHELCPVLLTWHASDDTLTSSVLLPFPSLLRGGLHHAEIAASEAISGKRVTLSDHMTSLALQAYCWPEPDDGFAIKRIAVDLNGANGTEPLFSAGAVAALIAQFGIEIEPRLPDREEALSQLGAQLRAEFRGGRAMARAKSGRTLILPADGFPSLSCLVARRGGPQPGKSSFCVVDAGTREPQALVCQPATSAALSALRHPALPLPCPAFQEEGSATPATDRHFGAPIMIRFREAKVWKIDGLMPLSPDTPVPTLPEQRPANDQRPRIAVIIDQRANDDQLSLCLASLAHQSIADDLDLVLIGDESVPPVAIDLFGEPRIVLCPAFGASLAERINGARAPATTDYLLFLDATVCLPDPRTLAVLLTMASQPQTASASCALVREDVTDGSIAVECAGYFEQAQARTERPGLLAPQPDVAEMFPASTFPVVANDMRLCLVPSAIWRDLGGLNAQGFPESGFDADFGLRAGAAGFEHHCTTLIRAAVARPLPITETVDESEALGESEFAEEAEVVDEIMPPTIPPERRDHIAEQVSRIRKLRR